MKKIALYIAMALMVTPVSCNKIEKMTPEAEEGLDCLVTINPIGEITTSESPLTKATLTDDIYCVQVYKGNDAFAMGYFDNQESMKLYLKQGAKYRIVVSMVKDAKTLLGSNYNLTQNSLKSTSNDIFTFKYSSGTSSYSTGIDKYFNTYFYNTNAIYSWYGYGAWYPVNYWHFVFKHQLCLYASSTDSGLSTITKWSYGPFFNDIEHAILGNTRYPTCTDWFYGEVNNYTPTGDYETMDIDFRRVGFKLKYELSGVTDGEVTVTIKNATRTFINNTTSTTTYSSDTQFIAFYDTKSAWKYAADYSEQLEVGVVWKRGIGVTQDLGTKTIQVKRNCLNNVKIALGNDDRGAGVSMALESDAGMDGATTDIPVQ